MMKRWLETNTGSGFTEENAKLLCMLKHMYSLLPSGQYWGYVSESSINEAIKKTFKKFANSKPTDEEISKIQSLTLKTLDMGFGDTPERSTTGIRQLDHRVIILLKCPIDTVLLL